MTYSSRRAISVFLSLLLAFSTIVATGFSTPAKAAGLASCSDAAGQTSNVTISASHGQVFYIDSAAGQNLDAAYVGYQVTANSTKTNLWARIDTFKGGVVSLASPSDLDYNLGDIASGSKKTSFFLLKASSATVAAQTHTIRIFSGKPGLATSTEIRSCTFSFLKVKETIKANPNKVNAVTTSPTNTSGLSLGSTFTVKVVGDTGTIGSGSAPDNSMIWLSPSSRSNWPTNALRLESSVVRFGNNSGAAASCSNENVCQFTNQLLVTDLLTKAGVIQNNAKSLAYEATYTFRVIGKTSAAVPILPVSQISSGTQVKHTPIPASAINSIGVNDVTINASATKAVSNTAAIAGSNTEFSYTITASNNGSNPVSVDQITDTPSAGLSYVSGSASLATFSVASGGTATSIITPNAPSLQTGTSNQIFTGPFSVPAGGRIQLSYRMSVATCTLSTTYSYTNSATATIGSLVIGSQPSTFSSTSASGTCGNTSVTGNTTNQTLPIEVVTSPATSIGNNIATLNGTVDPNGQSGLPITYEYGQTSNLSSFTSVSTGTTTSDTSPYSVTSSLSGLSAGTIYYYRIRASSVAGQILSFVTTEPTGTPSITTDPASNVIANNPTYSGVLNATVDPNQTSSYVTFTFSKTSSNLSSGTFTARMLDDPTVAFSTTGASPNLVTVYSGAFPTQVSLSTTDVEFSNQLSVGANDTIYYRANVLNTSGVLVSSGVIRSFTLAAYSNQTITFNSITDKSLSDNSITLSPTTNAPGLTVTLTSATPTICSVSGYTVTYLLEGDCTLEASQAGGRGSNSILYYAADPVVQTFSLSKNMQTVSFTSTAPNLAVFGSGTYSAAGTATSGLTPAITSATTSVCTVDGNGLVTYVAAGTCTLNINQSGNSAYSAAAQVQQSFTIDPADRTLTASSSGVNNDPWGTTGRNASALATADDTDSKTYVSTDTDVCTVDGSGGLTLIKPGTCSIYSTISQGRRYKAKTSNTVSFTVGKKDHTLTGSNRNSAATAASVSMAVTSGATTNNSGLATTAYSIESGTNTAGCSVDTSGVVTFTSAGECYVLSENTGNTYWKTGTGRHGLTLSRVDRTITATTNGANNDPWGTSGKSASSTASADDSDSKTYSSADTSVCTVNNSGSLTLLKPGTCSISATVSQGNRYNSATSNNVSFTVGKKDHTLSGMYDKSVNVSESSISMSASSEADSNLTGLATTTYSVSGSDSDTAGCSVNSSGVVTWVRSGECSIIATNTGNDYWKTATTKKKVVVNNKLTRTLNLTTSSPTTLTWKASGKSISASTNDDNDDSKSYVSSDPDVCTVDSSGNLTFLKPGHCVVTSTIVEGTRYNSAVSNSLTFMVEHEDRNLNLTTTGQDNDVWGYTGRNASASAGADDDSDSKTYTSADTNICTVEGNGNLTLVSPGTCSVTASIARGNRFKEKTSNSVSFVVSKKPHPLSGSDRNISVTSTSAPMSVASLATTNNSGLASTLYSIESGTNTAGCSVDSSGNATFTAAGQCYVLASNSGNSFWATGASRHKLTVDRATRTLTASTNASNGILWGTTGKSASAVATDDDSDGKTFSTSDPSVCTTDSSGNLTLHKSGTCSVTATVAQGNRFNSAVSNTVTFTVAKKDHTLSGLEDKSVNEADSTVVMNAAVSSGTSTTRYSITGTNTAGCTVNEVTGLVSFTKSGECEVTASNDGDDRWNAATPLKKKITVNPRSGSSPTPSATPTTSPTPSVTPTTSPTPKPSNTREPVANRSPSVEPSLTPIPSPTTLAAGAPVIAKGALPKASEPVLSVPAAITKAKPGPVTVDLGNGPVESFDPGALGSSSSGRRTITQLAAENLKGFTPSTNLIVEVIGAKTSGQFVVVAGSTADPIALSRALDESTKRSATDFSQISSSALVKAPAPDQIIGGEVTPEASYLFTSSNLGTPITVGDLDLKLDTRWIKVDAQISTYKPGSIVYLAVTTQPIIIGAAKVSASGEAAFSGFIPVSALKSGGHNVRVVGMRELSGVSTDGNGQVILSDSTLEEIQRFDAGTFSTVKVSGFNPQNGSNLVIRQVELSKFEPWWTVWIVLWTTALIAVARRLRKIETQRDKFGATLIVLIATLPALVLGWTTATYAIMGFGALAGLLGILAARLLPMKRK